MMASWKCLSLDEEGQNGGETQATFVCSHVEETKAARGRKCTGLGRGSGRTAEKGH